MHKIFYNDKPIILTTAVNEECGNKYFLLKTVPLCQVLETLKDPKIDAVYLVHHKEETLLKHFFKKLPKVIAGGGKVFNNDGDLLFIYRNDKWDLPKGKAEKNETIEETAIREVEEETGVSNLKITSKLPVTYHIFKRNGVHKLKITHWYNMSTGYNGKLTPQLNEGITKVEWLDTAASKDALLNSYSNIKLLF